ncbi:MAG: aminopeptidase N, partial [Bacillota bacterium]
MKQEKIYLKDYKAPAFSVDSIHLDFNLNEDFCRVVAKSQIKQLEPGSALHLNGEDLKLVSVKINGQTLSPSQYQLAAEEMIIPTVPASFTLEIETQLEPQNNTSLEGLYKSNGIFCTQCEAQGFRKITWFLDRPDVMTSYSVTIEADKAKYPVLLSNGDRIKIEDLGNGRHKAYWSDPHKKPCYLFALVAGDLGVIRDTFTTSSGRKVNLEVYAAHGKQERCWHAMDSLKKSMKWDEEVFGREYDLNEYMIVAIDDFNAGAMENKGLNIFNSRLVLADSNSATDNDFHSIESVVAHEYFHNWTGNRVTLRDWFQLSLKEGLTVFRDQEFSADMTDRGVQRIEDVDALRAGQFAEDAGPNAHPVRPESCMAVDNFFTMTIYEKGSELIRMMQTIVGRKGFRKGMDEYFKRHDGQAVTTDDFAAAISEPNGKDFTQFKRWYHQSGTPVVSIQER